MNLLRLTLIAALAFMAFPVQAAAPKEESDVERQKGVNSRGDTAMGFSHEMTIHHFGLTKEGGFIDVTIKDSTDTASLAEVRQHLQHIERAFSEGDFAMPMFTHGKIPPGVPTMQKLKDHISYQRIVEPVGTRLVIKTRDTQALKAIHEFLKFQIEDHNWGPG